MFLLIGCHSTTVSDGSSSVAMAVLPSLGTTCTSSAVDTAVVAGIYLSILSYPVDYL